MKSFVLIILLQVFVFTKGGGENPETNLVPPNTTQTTPSEVLSQLAQSLTPSPERPNTVMPVPPLNTTVQNELTMTTTPMPTTITNEETTTTNTTGAPSTEPMNTSYFIIGPPVQDMINTNTPTPPTTEAPTTLKLQQP
uniref:Uncharacterized protein n=1 Tax=Meloidogyne enterolobii TaxID=390850 RepID=A0A6V7U7J3_MELEN|nr:unnamed protein product [Meloidogyne enterolobii]